VIVDEEDLLPDSEDTLQDRLTKAESLYDERPPITDIMFNDRGTQLLYFYQACTIHKMYQNVHDAISSSQSSQLWFNSSRVQFSDALVLPFSIGIPFFGTHRTYDVPPDRQMCQWRYLSFGIATHRKENWTVACLLRSESHCRASHCGHVLNRERGRRLNNWTVVARLWGYRNPTNSLGCIVAVSGSGTRIAVANWNVVYIWALNPSALIEDNRDGFYPVSWTSAGSGTIELRPVVFRLDAVCFKMWFADRENELLALTDRGLVYWDLDPRGTGRTVARPLLLNRP
jgi:hypothetical protein